MASLFRLPFSLQTNRLLPSILLIAALLPLTVVVSILMPERSLIAAAIVTVLFLYFKFYRPDSKSFRLFFLLGFCIPLLPLAGTATLLVSSIVFLIIYQKEVALDSEAIPFLLIISLWTLSYALLPADYDNLLLLLVERFSDSSDWSSFQQSPSLFLKAFAGTVRWILFFLLVHLIMKVEVALKPLMHGVSLGMIGAAVIAVTGILLPINDFFVNLNPVWLSLDRHPGSFTDPNAMGIFSILVIPLLVHEFLDDRRKLNLAAVLAAVVTGILSGSRSFYLGAFIYTVWLLRKEKKILFLLFLLALLVPVVFSFVPTDSLPFKAYLPDGLNRVLSTLAPETMANSLFSRQAFFSAALAAISRYPLLGSGFARFGEIFPDLARLAEFNTGSWTDNSNNFYLGMLAETGLIGSLALLFFVLTLRPREGREGAHASAVILLILFMVGPHLDFDEVAVLAAIVVGSGFVRGSAPCALRAAVPVLLLLAVGIPIRAAGINYGLYPWESDAAGHPVRWITSRAQIAVKCESEKGVSFSVRSVEPEIARLPLKLKITSSTGEEKLLMLDSHVPEPVQFSCHRGEGRNSLKLTVHSSRYWIPAKSTGSNDFRRLAVQLSLPEAFIGEALY